jgi:uncharacterized membrane protein YuzA (DUF378 family)
MAMVLGTAAWTLAAPLSAHVSAVDVGSAKEEVCLGAGAGSDCDAGGPTLEGVIEMVVNIFSVIVGVVAVIMLMYGGFKYVTSRGDSGEMATAKNTIIYALIGIAVVALAQFFVFFVLEQIVGGGSST